MSTTETLTFEALGLPKSLLAALERAGYTAPTPIQREAIPPLLEGRDMLGQAATGTGKTAAFALPILSKLKPGASKPFETGALVLVPTRELALQVTESMKKYSDAMGIKVLAIYGGQEFAVQLRPLKTGVDVVVATPGRAIDHLKRKTLKLDKVRTVVLDEADEMLDMGFAEDLEVILSALPAERQVALFSATMPPRILKIAERQMKNPVRVSIARAVTHGEGQKVRQVAYVVPRRQKLEALLRVLELEQPSSALVFCRTRADVDELASVLDEKGFATEALHGGLSQDQRDRVMKKFKSGAVKYVVATDVAARGIHVDNLSHVINADVPTSPEVYVHRIGRTGRAGREGVAITFAEPGEVRLIKGLERAAGGRIAQLGVPSAEQVKGKKLKSTQNAVKAAMEAGTGESLRAWVDSLGEALPAMAAAAVELLHQAMHHEPSVVAESKSVSEVLAGTPYAKPARVPAALRQHGDASEPRASAARPARAHAEPRATAERPARHLETNHEDAPEAPPRSRPSRASAERPARPSAERPELMGVFATPKHEARAPRASAERAPPPPRPSVGTGTDIAEVRPPKSSADRPKPPRASADRAKAPRASAERKPYAKGPERPDRERAPARAQWSGGRPENERVARSGPRSPSDYEPRANTREPRGDFRPAAGAGSSFKRNDRTSNDDRRGPEPLSRGKPGDVVTLFVSAGTDAGIRPGDLVGAIANEAGLHSRQIGPIEIKEGYSLVGVPSVAVEAVIDALSSTKLRGRKVKVRREKSI